MVPVLAVAVFLAVLAMMARPPVVGRPSGYPGARSALPVWRHDGTRTSRPYQNRPIPYRSVRLPISKLPISNLAQGYPPVTYPPVTLLVSNLPVSNIGQPPNPNPNPNPLNPNPGTEP
jgi:hypothetical protein